MDTLQKIVQYFMRTVLEDFPGTLDNETINFLLTTKNPLGLKLSYTLIRRDRDGKYQKRYYPYLYNDRWYICSQWNKQYHPHNARRLAAWVETLVDGMEDTVARNRLLDILDRLDRLSVREDYADGVHAAPVRAALPAEEPAPPRHTEPIRRPRPWNPTASAPPRHTEPILAAASRARADKLTALPAQAEPRGGHRNGASSSENGRPASKAAEYKTDIERLSKELAQRDRAMLLAIFGMIALAVAILKFA